MSPDPCPAARTVPASSGPPRNSASPGLATPLSEKSASPRASSVLFTTATSQSINPSATVRLGFFLWTFLCDLCTSALSSLFVRRSNRHPTTRLFSIQSTRPAYTPCQSTLPEPSRCTGLDALNLSLPHEPLPGSSFSLRPPRCARPASCRTGQSFLRTHRHPP